MSGTGETIRSLQLKEPCVQSAGIPSHVAKTSDKT